MKKYYMSHVDFSEIDTITGDEITRENALAKLNEAGALNAKGKPDASFLSTLSASVSAPFFAKLQKRLSRRRGGAGGVYETLQRLYAGKEYTAMYLYIVIMYGFLEWQVPQTVSALPVVPEALKAFLAEFMSDFTEFINEIGAANEEPGEDDSE
jgi:hypothetical protein